MVKSQTIGRQKQPFTAVAAFRITVAVVANNAVPGMKQMPTNLVGPTCDGPSFDEADRSGTGNASFRQQ